MASSPHPQTNLLLPGINGHSPEETDRILHNINHAIASESVPDERPLDIPAFCQSAAQPPVRPSWLTIRTRTRTRALAFVLAFISGTFLQFLTFTGKAAMPEAIQASDVILEYGENPSLLPSSYNPHLDDKEWKLESEDIRLRFGLDKGLDGRLLIHEEPGCLPAGTYQIRLCHRDQPDIIFRLVVKPQGQAEEQRNGNS